MPGAWAIIEGQTKFGVTMHYIDQGVDSGNIIAQNTGRAGSDTLTGIRNIIGSDFDDIITGDANNNLLLIPELHARVTILDEQNHVVARLGADVERVTTQKGIRADTSEWIDGKFVHPHDACFDGDGNIFVAEWVASGRISKLKRLA